MHRMSRAGARGQRRRARFPLEIHRMFGYGREMSLKNALYDQDFHAWANTQAELLRAGKLAEADIENIAEEIESMGRSEKKELASRLAVLLMHLLKWQFQPGLRSKSWERTIRDQRLEIDDHLADNPSLKPKIPEALMQAYRRGRSAVVDETKLDESVFPDSCPWTAEEIMSKGFLPGDVQFAVGRTI